MGTITTHALDTAQGIPARGLPLLLESYEHETDSWAELTRVITNDDGRVEQFTDELDIVAGIYRITFLTSEYFRAQETIEHWFYPYVVVTFEINDPENHFHVPLLISPFGYSTYRGS